jgi:acyl-CoA thioester hydrolase
MKTHTTEQVVRYAETDRMQVVHHSTYLLWFEIGRTGLLAEAGFPYHELEENGMLYPVLEFSCRMVGSVDYGDTVTIETRVAEVRSRAVGFEYTVTNNGRLIATGMTRHVSSDANLKPRRMADELIAGLERYLTRDGQ